MLRLAFRIAAIAISVLSWPNGVIAGVAPNPLFASDPPLDLTVKAPFDSLSRGTRKQSVTGVLTVRHPVSESLPISLSVRGTIRRMSDYCSFPPLRIRFKEPPAETSLFQGQRTLKLVTYCRLNERYQQYVLLEFAAYRLYRALTPESFGVRLARIDYVDPENNAITSRIGFLIEDIDDVAARNGKQPLRGVNRITIDQLDPAAAARLALFQYMIGNLDWSMTAGAKGHECCHNAKLIGAGPMTRLVPVPYDFDFAGLVDAPYALPPENIRVRDVKTRRYRGFCSHNEEAQKSAAGLLMNRKNLLAVLDATPQLADDSRRRADAYLEAFFDRLASPSGIVDLMKTCWQ